MKTFSLLKALLVGVLFIGGCSSQHLTHPDGVIVHSGGDSIFAFITEGGQFNSTKTEKLKTLSISGTVESTDDGYLVQIWFFEKNKLDETQKIEGVFHRAQEIQTSVFLQKNEPIVLGGVKDNLVSLELK